MTPSRFPSLVGVGLILGALTAISAAAGTTTPDPQGRAQTQSGRGASAAPARSLTFEIYKDRSGEHRWRLLSTNGQTIATSGQGYKDKRDCKSAVERIKKDAATKLKFETYEDNAQRSRW